MKKTWTLEFFNEDGKWTYILIFKDEITEEQFDAIMEEARIKYDRFECLYDESFQSKHNIERFEEIQIDYCNYIEPKHYVYEPDTCTLTEV